LSETPRFPLIFHLPSKVLELGWDYRQVYGPMVAAIKPLGAEVRLVPHDRATVAEEIAADDAFHILNHGQMRHPRVLNCSSAYIAPFHYLDAHGIRALSSIGEMEFDAAQVDAAAAKAFHKRLFARTAGQRISRYDQPSEQLEVPKGCIAVFLQAESHRGLGETLYVPMRRMIKALLERDDPRAIVVKPHPRDVDFETLGWLLAKAKKDARLQISYANIHDMLAACSLVVTINSAVGIEAMVHAKPVVICGKADFHHCTEVVHSRHDFDAAIARAESRDWPFAAYLYWFFRKNCLSLKSPTLGADILAKIRATGYFEAA
jgi:hypothetical protein